MRGSGSLRLVLATIVGFGALGMHGLVPAEQAAETVSQVASAVSVQAAAPIGHGDAHGGHPTLHDAVLCVWIVAGAFAIARVWRRERTSRRDSAPALGERTIATAVIGSERGPPPRALHASMVSRC